MALIVLAAPATSGILGYPGAAPCDTTLQACIDGATSGDEIEIATAGPIDEALSVSKSLTLRAAFGFAPVIGGGVTTRVLNLGGLGGAAANETVVIERLTFSNARIAGFITQATGHSITIRDNVIDFELAHNNTHALDMDYRVPGSLVIAGNEITSTGQGIHLLAIVDGGSVDYRIERNIITTSLPEESNAGIAFDLRGTGTYTMSAFSNVVYGVGGCSCGNNAGIVLDVVTAAQVVASLTNNTVNGTETATGVNVLVRDPGAVLTLNLFNNSISNSERWGFRLDNFGEGAVTLAADANNSYMNANGDDFEGMPAGIVTGFQPMYTDAMNGDLRLAGVSQLIDAGVDAPTGGTSVLDADDANRIMGPQIDIGAYEFPAGTVFTYPSAEPCDTTLQACIDGVISGDVIEIATEEPIDEALAVSESLTLRPASGFVPVIGGGVTTRVLDLGGLGGAAASETVVIEGLTFRNARIAALIAQASGHSITIRDNVIDFEFAHNNTHALDFDYRVPGNLLITGNEITSTGQGIRLFAFIDGGSLDYRIERNIITTSLPEYSSAGISFGVNGTAAYTMTALSNVVYGVGGCACGATSVIVVNVATAAQVVASLTNNTIDGAETATGITALVGDPGAVLTLNLFNNSVSNSEFWGFRIDNFGEGTVILDADANNSYMNANGDDFEGMPAGTVTGFDPMYIDAMNGDFRLAGGSQLIDAGVDAPTGGTSTFDADGAARIQGGQIDIGAYEVPEPGARALILSALATLTLLGRARNRASPA